MATISQMIFSDAFLWMINEKFCISIKISLQFASKGPLDNNPEFGLDNSLVPNLRQAIIWTNAYPIYWSIYAALEGNMLNH